MTFMYPAVFTERVEGGYTGFFPDLEGVTIEGADLERAIADAQEALYSWLTVEFEEEESHFPMITDLSDMELSEGQIARNISVHYRFHVGWDE